MKAPSPPDPMKTAAAQGSWNTFTAQQNQSMNMIGQNTPWGTLDYQQTGTQEIRDPSGKRISVPMYTANVGLSPAQRAIFDQTQQAQTNLAQIANSQSAFLKDYLGKQTDISSLPKLVSDAGIQATLPGWQRRADISTKLGSDYRTKAGLSTSLGNDYARGVDLAASYAGADDFSADRDRYTDALLQRMSPQMQEDESRLRSTLINQGIRPGTAAWDAEWNRHQSGVSDARLAAHLAGGQEQARMVGLARDAAQFGNDAALAQANFGNNAITNQFQLENAARLAGSQFTNDALSNRFQLQNAARLADAQFANSSLLAKTGFQNQARMQGAQFQNAARQQGMGELFAMRNQPLNEVIGLLGGSQIQNPTSTFAQAPQVGVGGVDYTSLVNQKYQAELQNHQSMMGGLFGIGSGILGLFSDRRLKTDIKRVGTTDDGVPIFTYRYKGDQVTHMGVMAQDLLQTQPDAVGIDPSGFFVVDYRKVH